MHDNRDSIHSLIDPSIQNFDNKPVSNNVSFLKQNEVDKNNILINLERKIFDILQKNFHFSEDINERKILEDRITFELIDLYDLFLTRTVFYIRELAKKYLQNIDTDQTHANINSNNNALLEHHTHLNKLSKMDTSDLIAEMVNIEYPNLGVARAISQSEIDGRFIYVRLDCKSDSGEISFSENFAVEGLAVEKLPDLKIVYPKYNFIVKEHPDGSKAYVLEKDADLVYVYGIKPIFW